MGDDTTRIATSLLARLGVPVIGIVDGDEDGICGDPPRPPVRPPFGLRPGNDDQLGAAVRDRIFGGNENCCIVAAPMIWWTGLPVWPGAR